MKKFKINYIQSKSVLVEVEAETYDEAKEIADNKLCGGCLDAYFDEFDMDTEDLSNDYDVTPDVYINQLGFVVPNEEHLTMEDLISFVAPNSN